MDRLTRKDECGDICASNDSDENFDLDDWYYEATKRLAYYEDLEVRCGIIVGVTIEDTICSYERLEKKLKEMNNP